jgi:hypothetical protein
MRLVILAAALTVLLAACSSRALRSDDFWERDAGRGGAELLASTGR